MLGSGRDYYRILGLLHSIDPEALMTVYRAWVRRFHPDVFKGDPTEADRISNIINEAYLIDLKDSISRWLRDRLLRFIIFLIVVLERSYGSG